MRNGLATIGKSLAAAAMLGIAIVLAISQFGSPVRIERPAMTMPLAADTERAGNQRCGGSERLAMPVAGVIPASMTDTFSDARSEGRRHDAIDIMAPRGTPVLAAAPGRVEKLFLSDAGGNTVYVRSPDGRRIYYYAHLDSYVAGLREGQAVVRGTPIGEVGFSGNANPAAPHLHFAVMATTPARRWSDATTALNPFPLLVSGGDCGRQ